MTLEEGKAPMLKRFWAPAAVAVLLVCATAQATPVTVNLRVEGSSSTIFEGPVTTDGKTITKGPNTVVCDGTISPGNPGPGPTVTSALDDGSIAGGFTWDASFSNFSNDFFVSNVAGEAQTATRSWGLALNYRPLDVGGCQQQVSAGDEVLVAFDFFGGPPDYAEKPLLRLRGPGKATTGQPVSFSVDEFKLVAPFPAPREFQRGPAAGAVVGDAQTDQGGTATLSFNSSGLKRLKAERAGSIRSNGLLLCVSETGTDDCGVPPARLGSTGGHGDVRDSTAPVARISGPRHGRKYRRGPRLLRGTVGADPSGVREVKLALRRHVRGRPCQWWSGRRERFVGTHCRKVFFFSIGDDRDWSYLLPRPLPPGRYVLDVKAFDGRRNRDERFVSGRNRVVFTVAARRRAVSRVRGGTVARRTGAPVQVMVVGKQGTIVEAVSLRARATLVRASGRACKVAASTPLAALAAVLRRAGVSLHVRDFGTCKRRDARSSGQLFVDRVAGDRNRAQDGWVYKVNDRAPNRGAADVSGGGRLRSGDRVVWLYCTFDPASRSCQRTLRVLPSGARRVPGGILRVRVRGYDNERRATPAAGARVTLGQASALADASGTAALVLPAAGVHLASASMAGAVPSFPVRVVVR
jgi:hypothetical protein